MQPEFYYREKPLYCFKLNDCLAPVVEEGDFFNMEKEIWEQVRKVSVAATPSKRAPHWKESLHRCPVQRSLPALLHLILQPWPNQKGWHLLRTWPWCLECSHHCPWVFFHGPKWPCNATFRRCILVWSYDLDGPLHTRDDNLTHPSDGWGPLPPSGSKLYQNVPIEHFLPGATGTLPKGKDMWNNYNAPLYYGNTGPKHWPKQIPTLPMKWILDWAYTCSPSEVNFRIKQIPTLNQRKPFKSIN